MSAVPNNSLPQDGKEVVAARLAEAHRDADPSIVAVYRVELPGQESNPAEPVKLLEVNPNTTASGIMPVRLTAHPQSGIFYPSIIIEVHPSEWEQLQRAELTLPHGWVVGQAI